MLSELLLGKPYDKKHTTVSYYYMDHSALIPSCLEGRKYDLTTYPGLHHSFCRL